LVRARSDGKTPAQVMIRWHLQEGSLRDPEIGAVRTDRRELRRVELRAHGEMRFLNEQRP
jgi:diketogulonate reductase-like aldo/keto reductase